ncbi:MAG: type II/IV secretion system protein [Proteobacteria bacterium]|nr:MAG: type II/IV secretion system protein [Pseudomonadota bacterium]QKK10499.1 MAG: type II/IV secretion system protein [Pseudomonadota bacterium]
MARQRIRLGDLLVEHSVITTAQLQEALGAQKKLGLKLGRTLIRLNAITEDKLLDFLAQQLQVPFIDLKRYQYNAEAVRLLPETYARRFRAIVLNEEPDGHLLVGMSDPTDIFSYDEICRLLGRSVRQAIVRESDALTLIDQVYRHSDEIVTLASQLDEEMGETGIDLDQLMQNEDTADAPVVKLLQTLFEDAVRGNASDIHIEPDEQVLRIRMRVDGVLQEQVMKERRIASALVSRLKLMCGLDISEKRLPQDGRFNIRVSGRAIDVRLSTMPVQYGESVVMRLLDHSAGLLDLDHMGMPAEMLNRFRRLIHRPYGMILVTGPTGSGKTTTLYAALNELNVPAKKIITVEDPVEYKLPRINQVQVNFKINLTFAGVLRSALRQDPDIIMVGEMRDEETMRIGLRSALTGHLVLSTLHTNDAVGAGSRLIDMGGEGYLVASGLRAVLAQRLIRKICEHCKQSYTPDAAQSTTLETLLGTPASGGQFMQGAGCNRCNNTGYRGRLGVFELLELDSSMMNALRREDTAAFTTAANDNPGYRSLTLAAYDYAREGVTSLDEVLRVAGQVEESGIGGAGVAGAVA